MGALAAFDVAIIGGGPAGAMAATILARSGLRVLLVEASPQPAIKVGEALPPAAMPLLRDIGVWSCLERDGHLRSYGNESSWGGPALRSTDFVRDPNGHGWHVDRVRFDATLRDAAREAGASVFTPVHVHGTHRVSDKWYITLDANGCASHATATWLVDCTGRKAVVGRSHGGVRVADDRLVAFISRFRSAAERSADDIDAMTVVESGPHGWWYTARVPTHERVVVYLTDSDDATARQARAVEGFMRLVDGSRHVRARLAACGYAITTRPTVVPAGTSRLVPVAGHQWVAAGDAAVSFDPLSSQGMLTALYSGMRAAQAVASHLAGDCRAMAEYGTRVDTLYATYLERRREYYAYERRWPHHDFWRRRHDSALLGRA